MSQHGKSSIILFCFFVCVFVSFFQKYTCFPLSSPKYFSQLGRSLCPLQGQSHLTHAECLEMPSATTAELGSSGWDGSTAGGINGGLTSYPYSSAHIFWVAPQCQVMLKIWGTSSSSFKPFRAMNKRVRRPCQWQKYMSLLQPCRSAKVHGQDLALCRNNTASKAIRQLLGQPTRRAAKMWQYHTLAMLR